MEIRVFSDTAPQGEKLLAGEVTAVEAEFDPEATVTVVRGPTPPTGSPAAG